MPAADTAPAVYQFRANPHPTEDGLRFYPTARYAKSQCGTISRCQIAADSPTPRQHGEMELVPALCGGSLAVYRDSRGTRFDPDKSGGSVRNFGVFHTDT